MRKTAPLFLCGIFLLLSVLNNKPILAEDFPQFDHLPNASNNLIPKEPGWKDPTYRGWELVSIPGLISTYYDLNLDGKLDYQVIRKIIRKASGEELSIKEAVKIAKFDNLAIYVSYPVIYFTNKNPLFYCKGLDFRKNCDHIWIDIAEDGLNGNETLYTLSRPRPFVR